MLLLGMRILLEKLEKKWRQMKKTNANKLVLHHDDPPCNARLNADDFCPVCKIYPDMQSTCFMVYCYWCDVPLKKIVSENKLQCPKCKQKSEHSLITGYR
jgi:hypothetical protein